MGILLLVLGLLPAAVLVLAPRGRMARAAAAVAVGVLLIVTGSVLMAQNEFLDLRLALISWRILVQSVSVVAPVGLLVTGIAAVLVGIGMAVGSLTLLRMGMVGCSLVALWFAVGLLAASGALSGGRRSTDIGSLSPAAAFAALMVVALATLPRLRRWAVATVPGAAPADPPSGHRTRRFRSVALLVAAACAAVAIGVGVRMATAPQLVLAEVFPDPVFAGCVATELGERDASATVSSDELADVLSLSCNGDLAGGGGSGRVSSIEGTQRLTSLASLDLSNNSIAELAPLAGLQKLGSLKLTHNQITDLTPLAALPVLADLGASDNLITDLRPLAQVPTLASLGVSMNQISDLAPLAGLTDLSSLSADRNELTDVTALAGLLQLDTLKLSDNRISDPAPLAGLAELSKLDVARNEIADATAFAGFAGVSELWIGGNPVNDIRPLLAMPSLIGVDLEGTDPAAVVGIDELRARSVYVGGLA